MVVVLGGLAARRPAPALPIPGESIAWSAVGLLGLVGAGSPGPRAGREMFPDVAAESDSNTAIPSASGKVC